MKIIRVMLALMLIVLLLTPTAFADGPNGILSETYVAIDAKSGQVLVGGNENKKMYPASITKILTCALALKYGNSNDKHTMSYEAVHSIDSGSTHIALDTGEVVSVNDLLHATMLESANDAANGLAEYVSGSISEFVVLMNKTLQEIGAVNTNFTNPSGLHDANHYSTAYDMALITQWALSVDGFRELFGAYEYTIEPTNKQSQQRPLGTRHHMIVTSAYYYEGATGGKLGWTPEAKHTLVTVANRGDMEVIAVVMKTQTQYEKYKDTAALFDYCFDNFTSCTFNISQFANENIPVFKGDEVVSAVNIPVQEISIVRPPDLAKIDISMEFAVPQRYEDGEEIAPTVSFSTPEGESLGSVELQWQAAPPDALALGTLEPNNKDTKEPISMSSIMLKSITGAVAFISVAITIMLIIRMYNLKKLRERRRRQRQRQRAYGIKKRPQSYAPNVIDVRDYYSR